MLVQAVQFMKFESKHQKKSYDTYTKSHIME